METDVGPSPENLFRPVKRRKFQRRRVDDSGGDPQPESAAREDNSDNNERPTSDAPQEADDAAPTTDIIRLRRSFRPRRGGIEFSTAARPASNGPSQAQSAMVEATGEDAEDLKIQAMSNRFTAHSGQEVDVDKHMYVLSHDRTEIDLQAHGQARTNKIRMDYIESEMARRSQRDLPPETPFADTAPVDEATGDPSSSSGVMQREPATLGKLHEIDLGQENRLRNIARTQAATRRLAGDDKDPQEPPPTTEGKKSGHSRKERSSQDIERDRLVEEVLRESRRMYFLPISGPHGLHGKSVSNRGIQWMSTTNRKSSIIHSRMTKPQTTKLQINSGKSSSKQSSLAVVLLDLETPRPSSRTFLVDRNGEVVGALVRLCVKNRHRSEKKRKNYCTLLI